MPRRRRVFQHPAQTDFTASLSGSNQSHLENDSAAAVHEGTAPLPVAPDISPFAALVPVYSVKLVRTDSLMLRERPTLSSPGHAADLLFKHLRGADREYFVALLLDTKNGVIGVSTISIGDLTSALVHPREVFKPAILANAAAVLLAHNHPSGDPTPSPEDLAVTTRLAEAGELLGIEVLDHVVLGEPGRWISLRERGLFSPNTRSADRCKTPGL